MTPPNGSLALPYPAVAPDALRLTCQQRDRWTLENLPMDPTLPPIPLDGARPPGKQAVSEAVTVGLIAPWAEMLSFGNEKEGSPIHEVTPIRGMEMVQCNSGRTEFRMLYGRCNHDTATLILNADQDAASPSLRSHLSKPVFYHASPVSFSLPEGRAVSGPGPILWRDAHGIARVAAASSSIESATPEARAAIDAFHLDPARIVVGPGAALHKNYRVLHGRDAVKGPRWLQRAYFKDSLEPLRRATHSHPRAFCFDARTLLA